MAIKGFRFIVWVAFCLILAGWSVACSDDDSSWEQVQRRGVLRIGLDPSFPPFENADTGELMGIDVDLGRALAAELGLEAEFLFFGYDGLYDALLTEQVDVLISALVEDITRTRDFSYSEPYFNAGQYLVVRSDLADPPKSMAALDGRSLAVEIGSEGHVQAITWENRLTSFTIQTLPSPDDALWVVLQGEAEAALVDHVSGRLYRQQFPDLILMPEPVTVEPYAIVFRADATTLQTEVGDGLERLLERGEIDTITADWLDQ